MKSSLLLPFMNNQATPKAKGYVNHIPTRTNTAKITRAMFCSVLVKKDKIDLLLYRKKHPILLALLKSGELLRSTHQENLPGTN